MPFLLPPQSPTARHGDRWVPETGNSPMMGGRASGWLRLVAGLGDPILPELVSPPSVCGGIALYPSSYQLEDLGILRLWFNVLRLVRYIQPSALAQSGCWGITARARQLAAHPPPPSSPRCDELGGGALHFLVARAESVPRPGAQIAAVRQRRQCRQLSSAARHPPRHMVERKATSWVGSIGTVTLCSARATVPSQSRYRALIFFFFARAAATLWRCSRSPGSGNRNCNPQAVPHKPLGANSPSEKAIGWYLARGRGDEATKCIFAIR